MWAANDRRSPSEKSRRPGRRLCSTPTTLWQSVQRKTATTGQECPGRAVITSRCWAKGLGSQVGLRGDHRNRFSWPPSYTVLGLAHTSRSPRSNVSTRDSSAPYHRGYPNEGITKPSAPYLGQARASIRRCCHLPDAPCAIGRLLWCSWASFAAAETATASPLPLSHTQLFRNRRALCITSGWAEERKDACKGHPHVRSHRRRPRPDWPSQPPSAGCDTVGCGETKTHVLGGWSCSPSCWKGCVIDCLGLLPCSTGAFELKSPGRQGSRADQSIPHVDRHDRVVPIVKEGKGCSISNSLAMLAGV